MAGLFALPLFALPIVDGGPRLKGSVPAGGVFETVTCDLLGAQQDGFASDPAVGPLFGGVLGLACALVLGVMWLRAQPARIRRIKRFARATAHVVLRKPSPCPVALEPDERYRTLSLMNLQQAGTREAHDPVVVEFLEREHTEAKLREQVRVFNMILESTADAILVVDTNKHILHANYQFFKMWCVPPDLMDADRTDAFVEHVRRQHKDPDGFMNRLRQLRDSREEVHDFIDLKDGRIVERFSSPLFREGRMVGRIWTFRDVTEPHRSQQQIHQHARFLETLLNTISNPVFYKDREGRYLGCNQAFEQATMTPRNQIVGKTLAEIFPSVATAIYLRKERELLHRGGVLTDEWTLVHPVTKKSWRVVFNKATFNDAQGRVAGLIGVMSDVTDLRLREEELTRAKAQLERTNARLRESVEQARRLAVQAEGANHAKTRFLANMSHEFRTPLNGILGMCDMLFETPLDDRQRQYAGIVHGSAQSLLTLVNDLLDFSKAEAGCMQLESAPFDLRRLLEQTTMLIQSEVRRKALTLDWRLEPAVPRVLLGDAARLKQIVLNLLSNAVKFSDHGEVSLTVRPAASHPGRIRLRFEIADQGPGIPADKREELFEPFRQLDDSNARRFPGTGLGLAICRQLVEHMGGRIGVDARPEGGSRFWFEVELERCANSPLPVPQGEPVAAIRSPDGRPFRVLLAEDHPVNQQVARKILERLGLEVDVVASGREAVDAVAASRYDGILMDVQMPETDGLEATRQIRAARSGGADRRIPIIAMTAHTMASDREQCLQAGMDDYLTKPVDVHQLAGTLRKWMFQDGPDSGVADPPAKDPALPKPVPDGLVFDRETFMERVMGDVECAREAIDIFMSDMAEQVKRVRAAAEDRDFATVQRVAHAIKGAAANMAAEPLRHAAARMETAASRADEPTMTATDAVLQREFSRLYRALAGEVSRLATKHGT